MWVDRAATTCGEGVRTPGLELLNQAQGDVIGEPAQHLGVAQAASVEYAAKVHGMPGIVEGRSTLSLYVCGISRLGETEEIFTRCDGMGPGVASFHRDVIGHALGHRAQHAVGLR